MSTCPCSTDMRVRSTISPLGFSYLRARDIYFVISVHLFYPPQCLISSVQFSRSVVSDSLRPHELQHARLPCPSPTARVYPNPCPLTPWCHPTISFCRPLLLLPSIFHSIRVFFFFNLLFFLLAMLVIEPKADIYIKQEKHKGN